MELIKTWIDLIILLYSRNVDTMDLFMLPRDIRCRVLSLLLGAVKIERDQHIVRDSVLFCFYPFIPNINICILITLLTYFVLHVGRICSSKHKLNWSLVIICSILMPYMLDKLVVW